MKWFLVFVFWLCFFWSAGVSGQGLFGGEQVIMFNQTWGVESVYASDLNGDGYADILSASSFDDKIAWYKNDGNGNFGSQNIISTEANYASAVHAADIDGDGDMDVLSTFFADDKIAWYENDGNGNFGSPNVITTEANSTGDLDVADMDGDGDMDILSAHKAWYENDGFGNFSGPNDFFSVSGSVGAIHAVDIDGDGDMDALLRGDSNQIAWDENDGTGNFVNRNIITNEVYSVKSVYATDIDGDGDMDVLSASSYDEIAWYENDGNGNFGAENFISLEVENASDVYVADIDGDGDMDVLSASFDDDTIAWYENDGSGNFGIQNIIYGGAKEATSVFAIDIDNDGDEDVLSSSKEDHSIRLYKNDGAGNFGNTAISEINYGQSSTYALDLDGDGDADVLSASFFDNKVAWYENDGNGSFGNQNIITTEANGATSVFAIDIDGDGDADVLSASRYDGKIAWYENDGNGNFGSQNIITTETEQAQSVFAIDIDGDGDADVLSASHSWVDDKVAWYENDGNGNFGSQKIITTETEQVRSVYAADLDNDGDIDVLSASWVDNKVAWYENDGNGNFGSQNIISTEANYASAVHAADIDGDGDMDVLSTFFADDKIAWYENDGNGNFGSQNIITTDVEGAYSVYAADIDGDGDADVLSASKGTALNITYADDNIAWYENDGNGNFSNPNIIPTQDYGMNSVYAADFDKDGDIDVLSASPVYSTIAWHENLLHNPQISGYIFYDVNQNGILDIGESGLDYQDVTVEPATINTYANNYGLFAFYQDIAGEYTLNFNSPTNWTVTTPTSYTVTVTEDEMSTNNNFGIYPSTLITDISPYLSSGINRCNFEVPYTITYVNEGTTIGTEGLITFQPDDLTIFVSATPAPDSIGVNGGIFWHFNNLLPYQQQQIHIVLQMPGVENIGAELDMNAIVRTYDADGEQVDYSSFGYRPTVLCAYDPNDKQVNPTGVGVEHQTLLDEELIYTVRFQNTGNDTAFNIVIADTLSQHLDWETFRPITSSHAMQAYRMEGGKVEFHFNNILLVDSVANEPDSHGFVMYAVQPKADIADGTLIENTAYIFFDFNPPIVTNTTQNLMVEAIDMPVKLEVLLEGAYDAATGLMNTSLSAADLLPMQQPYGGSPWNYAGTEAVTLPDVIAPDICDWVLVEIRDRTDKELMIAAKAAFVRNDGVLMDINGSEGVTFNTNSLTYGESYYIVIRHRNHLDVISSGVVTLPNGTAFKMTMPVNVEGGTGQLADLGDGNYGMLAGDFNGDGVITVDDLNLFLTHAAILNTYILGDANLDGDALVQDFNAYLPNVSVIGVSEVRY